MISIMIYHNIYQAQSPDENALVSAARNFGFVVTERTSKSITIKVSTYFWIPLFPIFRCLFLYSYAPFSYIPIPLFPVFRFEK